MSKRKRRNVEIVADGLVVCSQCAVYIANSELPEDNEDAAKVLRGEKRELPNRWTLGTHYEYTEGGRKCDSCRRLIFGEAYEAALVGY